jgi:hypothetical protein
MVHSQQRPEEEGTVTSAAQLRGLSWEQVRRTALDVVENFCRKSGINPAEFMSNLGMMRSERWRQGINWRECVNWNQFNSLIFSAIPAEREAGQIVGKRFELGRFARTLRESHESFLANAVPRPQDQTARTPAAHGESASEQRRDEASARQEPAAAAPIRQMSDAVWSRLYSATESILDQYPQLSDDQRLAIQNIMERAGPGSRRLVAVNLTSYLREMTGQRVLSAEQATTLYDSLMGSEQRPGLAVQAESWVRQEREARLPEPTRMAARREERPAPARAETYVYRISVSELGQGGTATRTISTFEIASPRPLESVFDLVQLVREKPQGMILTRISSGGRRVSVPGSQLELFADRMNRLRFDPDHAVTITEIAGGRPRT